MYIAYDKNTLGWVLPWGWHIDAPWTKKKDPQEEFNTTNTQNYNTGGDLPQPTVYTPQPAVSPDKKKFPLTQVLIGAGIGLLLVASIYLYTKKK